GVLTDGYEWRFYVGKKVVRSFTLPQLLEETALFLEFWKEYTQPLNYYLQFFQSEQPAEDLNVETYRQNFFTDITTLINSFRNKLQLKGYLLPLAVPTSKETSEEVADKNSIEITYAYLIQFVLYKTLADNHFGDFQADFQQRLNRIAKGLTTHSYSAVLVVTKAISEIVSKNIYKPFRDEQSIINETVNAILMQPNEELADVTAWLDIFVFIKRYSFTNIRNEIFGFIYENYLKQLYNENLGQYFTPPAVTDFMLEQVGYTGKTLLKNSQEDKISIIDPSCGSGTFLYSAVRNIVESIENNKETVEKLRTLQGAALSKYIENLVCENVFGLDVAEFPLYLAEMGIIMRLLPFIITEKYNNAVEKKIKVFKTKDSVAEFLDTAVRNTLYDSQKQVVKSKGQLSLDFGSINLSYKSFIRDEDNLKALKQSLENQAHIERYRFDYVVGNPPYISYNEASGRGTLFFDFLKQQKVKLNDVYGVNLHSIPTSPKGYRPNPNLYAFFIALGLGLLKDKGKLCYIIPQTLLTAGDLDVIRYHLAKYTTIEKIVIINSQLFVDRGLKQNHTVATSNLIIVLRKEILPKNHTHKVAIFYHENTNENIENCINDIRIESSAVKKFMIPQEELLLYAKNWNFLKLSSSGLLFYQQYVNNSREMSCYYDHQIAQKQFQSAFYFDGGYMVMEKDALPAPTSTELHYEIAKIDEKKIDLVQSGRYVPNQRGGTSPLAIKLRQANQGYTLLDSTYKIIWSTRNPKQFHFTQKSIIWANNRLGGIGSENADELLYVWAILNSSTNRLIIKQLLKLEGEKDLLVQVNFIKEFI
ncbi:MAG: N-6 DNA methylase, partial [Thermoflexibacteraceae bacterium]